MKPGLRDSAGDAVQRQLEEDLGVMVDDVRVYDVYTIDDAVSDEDVERLRVELFTDPVIQESAVDGTLAAGFDFSVEIGFRPGVTDNIGATATRAAAQVLGRPFPPGKRIYKSTRYVLRGDLTKERCEQVTRDLFANDLIERWEIHTEAELSANGHGLGVPVVTDRSEIAVHEIDLDVSDEELAAISKRMVLALSLEEMQAIQRYYREEAIAAARIEAGLPEAPTDVEFECIAQTWSEHCKHKIFAANIDYVGPDGSRQRIASLFDTYIKAATKETGKDINWLVSVFHDNAGIMRFDDEYNVALKVETHNSPSALDPYGGALTGIVGVNRDILGAGLGCRCIFNTDVFCVASPEFAGEIPERLFHPKRVLRGVHRGVKDGGNQSGIPNVNGAIVFHDRFLGKPLVFCGTGGIIPARIGETPSEKKGPQPGDAVVMVGGAIGKDGIHGATFSSEALHEGSPATAVQIGDPITQKKMADFLLEARDEELLHSITDNGAGGLSSSIGEMARGCGGCDVHLDRAPLKYSGLAPWEIFLSEAQERMTLAVPQEHIGRLLELARQREVEATVLGAFNSSGYLKCFYDDRIVCMLDMDFLHNGVPTMELVAELDAPAEQTAVEVVDVDLMADLKMALGALNVCSKESFVRMYDHEVQGQSVLKQFQGAAADGPGNAAVIRPRPDSKRGLAVACGICPKFSDLDAYAMMANAVDEAVRNLLCVGTKLGTIAGLDNFCWPDPVASDVTPNGRHKLAQLVQTCQALHDVCVAYGIPLISGKDSMKNDYRIGNTKISIPPTVLFTAAGIVEDVEQVVSMDVKRPGDRVYVLGKTRNELGGSEYFTEKGITGGTVPRVDFDGALALYKRLNMATEQRLVASCHDCSDGGLGAALAESAFAGGYGMDLDITEIDCPSDSVALFSESASRFVVTVHPSNATAFENTLADSPFTHLGTVTDSPTLTITGESGRHEAPLAELKDAWQKPLDW